MKNNKRIKQKRPKDTIKVEGKQYLLQMSGLTKREATKEAKFMREDWLGKTAIRQVQKGKYAVYFR